MKNILKLITLIALVAWVLTACSNAAPNQYNIPDEVVRWPYKDAQHFITVRIPGCYRFLGGGAMKTILGPDYPDHDKQQGYATQLFIDTLWPDMAPRTQQSRQGLDGSGWGRKLDIEVSAIFSSGDSRKEAAFMEEDRKLWGFDGSKFATRGERMIERRFHLYKRDASSTGDGQKSYHFPLELLPGKFGLDHVGVDVNKHSVPPKVKSWRPDDFYFLRDKQGQLITFIRCSTEIDHEDDPKSIYSPSCDQHFFFAPLSGEVIVTYHRTYMADWRAVQAKTEKLLQSFIEK